MFLNQNAWDFGRAQGPGAPRVDHVVLPPWAKGSTPEARAHEFVRLSRLALESEYVSLHLHLWVDLIFGVDQRSEAKHNVFHPMSYDGVAEGMADEHQRAAAANHQRHYGQSPAPLFVKPHPRRLPFNFHGQTVGTREFRTWPSARSGAAMSFIDNTPNYETLVNMAH